VSTDVIPDRLEIDQAMFAAVVQHMRRAFPYEGCGLLATIDSGDSRLAMRFYPGENIDHSTTRFTMDPRRVVDAMNAIEQAGWSLGAIVHSHPTTEPVPSATDLREAFYPGAWLAILSFVTPLPKLCVWDVADRTKPTERIVTIMPA
jgi:proteasome lid subunit RPN8/RPN11